MINNNSTPGYASPSDPNYLKGSLYAGAALLIAFENAMVVISFKLRQKMNRGMPDLLILNLALSAICTCAAVVGIAAYVVFTATQAQHRGSVLCKVQYFFGTSLRLTELATTTVISIDRLVALWKPFFYRRKVKVLHGVLVCLLIWLGSGSVAALPFFGYGRIDSGRECICVTEWRHPMALAVAFNVYVQFAIVFICYIEIFRCISKFVKRQNLMTMSKSMNSAQAPLFANSQPILTIDSMLSSLDPSESSSSVGPIPGIYGSIEPDVYKPVSFSNKAFLSSHSHLPPILEHDRPDAFQVSVKKFISFENDNFKAKLKVERTEISSFESKVNHLKSSESIDLRIKAAVNSSSSWDGSLEQHCPVKSSQTMRPSTYSRRFSFPLTRARSDALAHADRRGNQDLGILRQWSLMVREKWRERKILRQSSKRLRRFWKESKYFAKVLGVVVIIFYCSSLPLAVTVTIAYMAEERPWMTDFLWICYNLTFSSSFAIPLAYALLCKPYREAYVRLVHFLSCCRTADGPRNVQNSSSATQAH